MKVCQKSAWLIMLIGLFLFGCGGEPDGTGGGIIKDPYGSTNGGTIGVDASDLRVTILSGPQATSTDRTPIFAFEANRTDVFCECKLNNASYKICDCDDTYEPSALDAGNHTFRVRAVLVLEGERLEGVAAEYPFNVYAPFTSDELAISLLGPDNPSNDDTPTFQFESLVEDDDIYFMCRLDDETVYDVCPSVFNITTGLSDGDHTFRVKAVVDWTPGVIEGPVEVFTWNIDTTPPELELLDGPCNGATHTTPPDPQWSFFCQDPHNESCQYEYALEAPFDWQSTGSPHIEHYASTGTHTIYFRGIDDLGNGMEGADYSIECTFEIQ